MLGQVGKYNSQIAYVGDRTYGVQKTTDGGTTWQANSKFTTSPSNIAPNQPFPFQRIYAYWGVSVALVLVTVP